MSLHCTLRSTEKHTAIHANSTKGWTRETRLSEWDSCGLIRSLGRSEGRGQKVKKAKRWGLSDLHDAPRRRSRPKFSSLSDMNHWWGFQQSNLQSSVSGAVPSSLLFPFYRFPYPPWPGVGGWGVGWLTFAGQRANHNQWLDCGR